jgi:hypothetical protein
MTRRELEEAFTSSNGERVRDALISAFYSEEGTWVQSWCLKLSTHPDAAARYGVAVVLGNIAVVRRNEIDLLQCLETVEKLSGDLEDRVRTAARDSLDSVRHAIRLSHDSQS